MVDGGVGLNKVVVGPLSDDAPLGADNASRDRMGQTEWVPDGHHPIPYAEGVGISEIRERKRFFGLNLEEGQVGLWVAAARKAA